MSKEIALNTIKDIGIKKDKKYNCIPCNLDKFSEYFPGVEKECYYLVTASSGIGKSKLTRKLFIYDPIDFIKNNPDCGLDIKIIFFSLEESIDRFYMNEICRNMNMKYNLNISIKDLKGITKRRITAEEYALIKKEEKNLYELEKYVEIIDWIKNPTGIFKHVRDYAKINGDFYFKEQKIDKSKIGQPGIYYDSYKAYNENQIVEIVLDHFSLLHEERNPETGMMMDKHTTISKMSSDYCITLRNKFKYTPVIVQQQAASKEVVEVNFRGQTIPEKLQPSLDGLADNKLTQRDCNVALGLFSPSRYEIPDWRGYDISILQNNYRQIEILKDRDGDPNIRGHFLFNGATNSFTELPSVKDPDFKTKINKIYNDIKNK